MPLTILPVACLADNYAYLLGDPATGRAALVDVPEAGPINAALAAQGWVLDTVLLTHHHADHVQGLDGLDGRAGATVMGAADDAHRLPPLDHSLRGGDSVTVLGTPVQVVAVPGHTIGHVAFHLPAQGAAFTADSLMALGCGRLFEGSAAQMWDSLTRLAALPPDTLVHSGHDYSTANAAFARSVDPDNTALAARIARLDRMRADAAPMAVAPLSEERATNPFLRACDADMKARLGLDGAPDADVFAALRARKDAF